MSHLLDHLHNLKLICTSFHFRLALYVYEYLLHVGAQKAAQTFLNEVRVLTKGALISEGILTLVPLQKKGAKSHPWVKNLNKLFTEKGGNFDISAQGRDLAPFVGNESKVKIPSEIKLCSTNFWPNWNQIMYLNYITKNFLFFLQIRWEKNITLGEPPGFLHSWWCVFWDLYCAAPERRETCDHSSEAKAFHDYVSDKFIVKQSH